MPGPRSEHEPCCPEFDRTPWDGTTLVWKEKPFIKESMPVFLHIPWPPMIGRLLARMWGKVQKADAAPEMKDVLILATDPSPWRTEWFMSVTRNVPDAENVALSGTFFTRVFDGPYSAVPKWIKEMDACLAKEDKKATKYYFHYTTCPKCAKLRGHNYVVAFAQLHPSTNHAAS